MYTFVMLAAVTAKKGTVTPRMVPSGPLKVVLAFCAALFKDNAKPQDTKQAAPYAEAGTTGYNAGTYR